MLASILNPFLKMMVGILLCGHATNWMGQFNTAGINSSISNPVGHSTLAKDCHGVGLVNSTSLVFSLVVPPLLLLSS